jgi:hypothetical protein
MDRQGTVIQHFVAGGIGGIANAILLLLLESVKIIPSSYSSSSATSSSSSSSNASSLKYGHWTTNTNYNNRLLLPSLSYHHLHVPTFRYTASLVLHNTLSHSILFGTYQLSKQCIEQQQHRIIGQLEYTRDGLTTANNGGGGGTNINNNRHDDINDHNDNIVQFATIATIAIAGGVAGQCQYVASYMSERWLGLVIDETTRAATTRPTTASTMKAPLSSTLFHNHSPSSSSTSSSNISLRSRHRFITSLYSTVPTVRSIVLSFPSSAIGFLAYEYGKLMME